MESSNLEQDKIRTEHLKTNMNDSQKPNVKISNNSTKLVEEEEDDDDELTRKIKAIPILPRIPKIKSYQTPENRQKLLEHKSVLHRKTSAVESDQVLKWPSSESKFISKKLPKKSIVPTSTNLLSNKRPAKTNGSSNLNSFNKVFFNNTSNNNLNQNKPLSSEEKFDAIFKKDNPPSSSSSSSSSNSTSSSSSTSTTSTSSTSSSTVSRPSVNKFECFEDNILDKMPKKPCKTLEDRMKERLAKMNPDIPNPPTNQSSSSSNQENGVVNGSNGVDVTDSILSSNFSSSSTTFSSYSSSLISDLSNPNHQRKVTFKVPPLSELSHLSPSKSPKKKQKKDSNEKEKESSQEVVVSIMKDFLKPYYSKQKITKNEYKEVLRKTVPKFSKVKSDNIKEEKILEFAKSYLKLLLSKKKKK